MSDRADILVVDDLPEKQLVLRTVLEELKQNIITARSGEEALRLVLERDFAVILLDINMPGMDGLETAGYIRRRKKSAHTPIIFITAYHDDEHMARGYSLGAVDYIFTPIVPDVLRSKVKVLVDLHRMTQQLRRQADERVALAREQAARAAAEEAARRQAFLADVGTALAASLELRSTLRTLAFHAVPVLADLAIVHPVDEQGRLGHPAEMAWDEYHDKPPAQSNGTAHGVPDSLCDAIRRSLQIGQPMQVENAGPWPAWARPGPVQTNGSAALLRSVRVLPLAARGRILGTLTLAMGPSGRSWVAGDDALAGDVAARAATALDNARLYQDIRQETERKNQFLAMLAHELRNPMAPIRNALGILKLLGAPDERLNQARDIIDRQVTQLSRLVDDLLDISRLAQGKVLLRKERLDLVELVRHTSDDYRGLMAGAGLAFALRLPSEPIYVDGDAARLSQTLYNLLHNAIKFTDGGDRVVVDLHAESDGASLTVSDTGVGMQEDVLARVFEPFTQADRTLERTRGGLGLGLALVRGLVLLHGGTVHAESGGLGKGTTISIRLPRAAGGVIRSSPAPQLPASLAAKRVLVIEDNPDTAESMRVLFAMTGHEVQIAHTGMAGLEVARQFHPQVVLCDLGLPGGMDGYAVARAIRRDESLASVRLIAISGYGQEEDRRRSHKAGFDEHLIKPIEFGELRRLIASHPARRLAAEQPQVHETGIA